jgi:hypothetical protein
MTNPTNVPGEFLMRVVDSGALRWWVNPKYTKHCKKDMTPQQKLVFQEVTERLTAINLELASLNEALSDNGLFVRVSLDSELSDHTKF